MTDHSQQDNIYSKPQSNIAGFTFDLNVARVFPDMIKRSVPGYGQIIDMICMLTRHYVRPNSNCYDLGCSLGAALLAIRHGIHVPGCRIIAVDNSKSMLDQCRGIIDRDKAETPVELVNADIRDIDIRNASVVVLNFTLQFIEPAERFALLKKIYDGMLPGGALILSEKIVFEDSQRQSLMTELHLAFKKFHGYSDLEISQKRSALENVLVPETVDTHITRLKKAGFARAEHWFLCLNFSSFIAVK